MDMNDNFENILAEMRGNEFDDPAFDGESIVAVRRLARSWADRLELAVKQKVSSAYNRGCREYGKYLLGKIRFAITTCAKTEGLTEDKCRTTPEEGTNDA